MGIKSPKWVETLPPRTGGKRNRLAYMIRTLKSNPNKWAEVAVFNKMTEVRTLSSRLRGYGLQVAQRRAGGGWTRVFARYNTTVIAAKKISK